MSGFVEGQSGEGGALWRRGEKGLGFGGVEQEDFYASGQSQRRSAH